ncbi:uncharacterized protein LOC127282256 [Leptopilina boulardi]|uniref:uncharacterized protein LOC127282256 n=1 Tax=Leptopilina boulardi TaxID=63433 RepID=UPI0021F5DBDA|nr:uncharacterized protein LOC127282256 [Leptopilina boulardi]
MDNVDETEVLIQVVSNYKFLYDKSSENFKNRYAKKQAWFEIAREVQNVTNIEITNDRAKRIWKKLKEDYTTERRKIMTYVASGSAATEESSGKKSHYYDSLQFLQVHVEHRVTRSNIKRSQPQKKSYDVSNSESSSDESLKLGSCENLMEEDLDGPSINAADAPSVDTRTIDYLAEMKRAWDRIPHKYQRKCFYIIEEIIEHKLKH